MSNRIKFIPQLDSLRAIAALMVIFYHFLRDFNLGSFAFGAFGVEIFFTISGFLITSILLEQKETTISRLLIIKNFIIKRALRLFPIYYIVLVFFAILGLFGLYVWHSGDAIFYFSYTTNFLFFFDGLRSTQLNHVWTLAIEEQFYLIWPWVLLFFPRKKEWLIIVSMIAFSIIFKFTHDIENIRLLTISHFDTLGSGALLALLLKNKNSSDFNVSKLSPILTYSIISIIVFLFLLNTFVSFNPNFNSVIILVGSIIVIFGCYINFTGWMGWIFNLAILKYLGKISYGIYLYHKFMPLFVKLTSEKLRLDLPPSVMLIISLTLTILLSHISYNFIEKRFISLKAKFDL